MKPKNSTPYSQKKKEETEKKTCQFSFAERLRFNLPQSKIVPYKHVSIPTAHHEEKIQRIVQNEKAIQARYIRVCLTWRVLKL